MNLLAMLGIDQNDLMKELLNNPSMKELLDNFNKFIEIQDEQLRVLNKIENHLFYLEDTLRKQIDDK